VRTGPTTILSAAWLAMVVLVALLAPLLAQHDPTQPVGPALTAPGARAGLGTDALGRDVWSRLAWGGRLSLGTSLAAAALTVVVGGIAGLAAAVLGGWPERIVLWAANAMLAIPGLLLALLLVAGLGTGLPAVILSVGFGGAPGFARLARTVFLQALEGGYVDAAVALGAGKVRIASRHLLPNARTALLSLATTHFAWAFMGTTTLSFLGLIGDPSTPEWGAMLNAGRATLQEAPWLALFPGLAISLTIVSIHNLGEYLARRGLPSSSRLT
jgi:peptide/nickel transport system permease protein